MLRNKMKKQAAEQQKAAPAAGEGKDASVFAEGAASEAGSTSILGVGGKAVGGGKQKVGVQRTAGELRIQKDITELDGGSVAEAEFPNPNDLTSFNVIVKPSQGYWSGGRFVFKFSVTSDYPHKPPKVVCDTKIYHPNINMEGAVCLNILRDEWRPVMDINQVIYGLCFLFYEPNPDDPLNREAAALYRSNRTQFANTVKKTLQGYSHEGVKYDKLI